jgi:hypothetical protein
MNSMMHTVTIPAGVSEGGTFAVQLDGAQLQLQCPVGSTSGQQLQFQAPAPVSNDMNRAPAAPQLPLQVLAAVAELGESITFRQKLKQNHSESRGFASFGASCSGSLPVLDGKGEASLNVSYASSDPRLRQLDASLTTARDGTNVAEFRRAAASGGMSSLVAVRAAPCQVFVEGQLYATITSTFSNEARLARTADPRLGAATGRGPSAVCCGPYTIEFSVVTGASAGTGTSRTMSVDSDSCLPKCPSCLICAFNLGQRRVCELGEDPLSRLDLLLLYTFLAVDPLTIVSSGGGGN